MTPISTTQSPPAVPGDAAGASCRPQGALTIQAVAHLQTQLLEGLEAASLTLNLEAIDACDSAGLQLLCALNKSARRRAKCLRLENLSPAIRSAAEAIGLDFAALDSTAI